MRLGWALVLLVASAGAASAGTEQDPEVADLPDHDPAALDLISAWLESASDGVVWTVKIRAAHQVPKDHFYLVSFDHDGRRVVALAGFDETGKPRSHVGAPNFARYGVTSPAKFADPLRDIEFTAGSPATISARIPWAAVAALGPGDVLGDIAAGTVSYDGRTLRDEDLTQSSSDYVVQETIFPLFVQRNTLPLALAAAALVLGVVAAAAWMVVRVRRARAAPPRQVAVEAPPPSPPSAPPTPPAEGRFRLRPP